MSGVKDAYVNLRQSELDNIMGSIRRADNFHNDLENRVGSANDRLRNEFKQNFADANQRQARFEQGVAGLRSDLRGLEEQQNQRIRKLNQQMEHRFEETGRQMRDLGQRMEQGFDQVNSDIHHVQQDMHKLEQRVGDEFQRVDRDIHGVRQSVHKLDEKMGREFQRVDRDIHDVRQSVHELDERVQSQFHAQRQEYTHLIERQGQLFQAEMQEQNRIFTQAMAEQQRELQSQIKQVDDRIRSKEQNDQQTAASWLADVRLILDNIDQNTRHAKFMPGAFDHIKTEFSVAENNHRNGQPIAALSLAQTTYLNAQKLRMELAQREAEWNIYLMQARTSAAEVLAMCDTQQVAKFTIDTEEGSEEIAAEIDYWTEGRLSALRQKVEAENRRLASGDNPLALDMLKASIQQSAMWMQESEEIAEAAREALIKSQVRQNIAQAVADSFDGTGWQLADSTYAGKDFRGALHTKFVDPSGKEEIVTIVHPEKAPSGEVLNRLEVNFFDKSNDERFRHARLQEIFRHMNEGGIDAGKPQTRKGYETGPGDQRVRDFERVRQQQRVKGT